MTITLGAVVGETAEVLGTDTIDIELHRHCNRGDPTTGAGLMVFTSGIFTNASFHTSSVVRIPVISDNTPVQSPYYRLNVIADTISLHLTGDLGTGLYSFLEGTYYIILNNMDPGDVVTVDWSNWHVGLTPGFTRLAARAHYITGLGSHPTAAHNLPDETLCPNVTGSSPYVDGHPYISGTSNAHGNSSTRTTPSTMDNFTGSPFGFFHDFCTFLATAQKVSPTDDMTVVVTNPVSINPFTYGFEFDEAKTFYDFHDFTGAEVTDKESMDFTSSPTGVHGRDVIAVQSVFPGPGWPLGAHPTMNLEFGV